MRRTARRTRIVLSRDVMRSMGFKEIQMKPTVSCPPDYVHQALSQRSLTGADYAARPGLRQFVVRPVKRRFRRILRFRVLWTPSPTLGLSRRRHAPARTRRLENGKPSLERMVIRAAAHRDPPVLTERAGASR